MSLQEMKDQLKLAYDRRNQEIIELRRAGAPIAEIMQRFGLKRARVHQILKGVKPLKRKSRT